MSGRAGIGGPSLLGSLVWVTLFGAACGEPDPASEGPAGRRAASVWAAAPGSPARPVVTTVRWLDAEELGADWTAVAPEQRAIRMELDGRRDPVLVLSATREDEIVQLVRSGPLDLTDLDHVRVTTANAHPATVELDFVAGDLVVATTEPVLLVESPQRPVAHDLPVPGGLPPVDRLVLRVLGRQRLLALSAVEGVFVPADARWPGPDDPPALVVVDGDGRRAVSLDPRRPLSTRVPAAPGSRLRFSWTAQRNAGSGPRDAEDAAAADDDDADADADADVALELRVDVGGDSVVAWRARVTPGAWHMASVDLGPWAGSDVGVSLHVLGPARVAVAETAVLPARDPRPSVLLVTSDTHRGDHLGAAGRGVDIHTPALDALAARGVLFEDCFSPTNITNPSHVALMTGAHPRDTRILTNSDRLSGDAPTVAERFREAGYTTWAALSAAHLQPTFTSLAQGFDRVSWPAETTRPAGPTIDVVERWLVEEPDAPVFLWVHLFDAHWPYRPEDEALARYWPAGRDPFDEALPPLPAAPEDLPPDLRDLRDPAYPLAAYRAEITALDAEVRRLFERPRFRDGISCVVGDHGESFGQHGIWYQHAGLFPDTLHVPLLLAWPGSPAGTRVETPVQHTDLAATLMSLAALEGPALPGRDLSELARGGGRSPGPRFALESHGLSASVTFDALHLILTLRARPPSEGHGRAPHQVELYDLAADPGCLRDLAAERPDAAADLRARLIAWIEEARPLGWSTFGERSAGELADLRQLGYAHEGSVETADDLWVADECAWCRRFDS